MIMIINEFYGDGMTCNINGSITTDIKRFLTFNQQQKNKKHFCSGLKMEFPSFLIFQFFSSYITHVT